MEITGEETIEMKKEDANTDKPHLKLTHLKLYEIQKQLQNIDEKTFWQFVEIDVIEANLAKANAEELKSVAGTHVANLTQKTKKSMKEMKNLKAPG